MAQSEGTCAVFQLKRVSMEFHKAIEELTRSIDLRQLKPIQLEAVESFVSGQDTFVALPTGYGKSVIFAVLPLLFDKLLG